MKIYILADMEGISGIRKIQEVDAVPGSVNAGEYAHGRRLMMAEINAAIGGCFDGGATEVVACDAHYQGGQVQLLDMDGRATYEISGDGKLMPALDETFAGVILIGHHGMAGTPNAFLEHTMSSATIYNWKMNGRCIGEIVLEACYAGHFNVPTLMISGDAAVCAEARAFFGDIETACVKWAVGRNLARCLPSQVGCQLVRETCRRAVERAARGEFKPYRPTLPLTMELEFQRNDYCDTAMRNPLYERTGPRSVRWIAHDLRQVCLG